MDEISAASLQMFRRGKELAVEIQSDDSGKLGLTGNVLFYGEKNDGARDSLLYVNPAAMPHSHYSLYSDTVAYFLTYNQEGIKGKRIEKTTLIASDKIVDYHFEEFSELFNSNYFTGSFYPTGSNFDNGSVRSDYDVGEGWTGKELNNSWQTVDVNTTNLVREHFDQTEIELVIVGRSAGEHEVEIWSGSQGSLGRKITTLRFLNYNSSTYKFSLQKEDTGPASKVSVSIYSKAGSGSVSVSYARWRYPQKTILSNTLIQKEFHFDTELSNANWHTGKSDGWQFYDCSDPYNLKKSEQNNSLVSISDVSKIIGWKQALPVNSMRIVRFAPFDVSTDYLVISHPAVRKEIHGVDPVAEYASYRASRAGGNYNPLILNSEDIYDRFNYGEPGPLGIKNLIAFMSKAGLLKFVFLIGRSTDPQTVRKLSNARETDMIPNAGWPGSDLALAMQTGVSPTYVPLVPVGRINALSSENVWTYLQKVKAMEAEPVTASWRKNILHLSGGRSKDEVPAFRAFVKSFENKLRSANFGARVETISKQTDAEIEQFPIHIPINKGVALMTLFGHSSLDATDIDIGYASDANRKYENHPFYPAVIVNGCALGSIFYSIKTISTDWIFSPKNGAVLFLAHTFNGISYALKHYTDAFYDVLADSNYTSEPFGVIQQEAIRRNMKAYPTLSDGITAQQMNLHGDPAIRIFPARLPDYAFDSTLIALADPTGNKPNVWSDSIDIQIGIKNNGRFREENYSLLIKDNSELPVIFQTSSRAVSNADTLRFRIANPFRKSGRYSLEIVIDPDNVSQEEVESNNVFEIEFVLPEGGAFPVFPWPDFVTNESETELVAQLPEESKSSEIVFEWDTTDSFSSSQRIKVPAENRIASHKIRFSDKRDQVIFWRVYSQQDEDRPSGSRKLFYLPESTTGSKFPEGVALISKIHSSEIQEGEVFSASALFRNITEQAFSDSITVSIVHEAIGKSEKTTLKIPPLKAKETRDLQSDFATIGELGRHQVSFFFNSEKLDEEIYNNNEVQFSYHVIPDISPPILIVNIDQRQLADGDFVSSQPQIGIQVLDENKFLVRNDTSGIEVFLKEECSGCLEQSIYLANANFKSFPYNDFRIDLKLPLPLKNGLYQLRVKAMDLSGNQAKDYQIHFRIKDAFNVISAGISPNPSRHWFMFLLETEGFVSNDPMEIIIRDLKGREVKRINTHLHSGINEWFWEPENLPAGMYFYNMEVNAGKLRTSSERKGLKGKLIWVK